MCIFIYIYIFFFFFFGGGGVRGRRNLYKYSIAFYKYFVVQNRSADDIYNIKIFLVRIHILLVNTKASSTSSVAMTVRFL